jgi:RND family efflux transporter MFP subunit
MFAVSVGSRSGLDLSLWVRARRWSVHAAALVGIATLAACSEAPAPEAAPAGPQVPVLAVGQTQSVAGLVLDGSLQAVQQSVLSAQVGGRVAQLLVKPGDVVRRGQALAVIDDRATQAGVAQSQASVVQAETELANAQTNESRVRDLHAQGFVAKAALENAQAQLKGAQAAAAAARAGQTQSTLAQGFTRVSAPYDGRVLATHVEAGVLAMPGTPIVTVYAPQPLRAEVHVPATFQAQAVGAERFEVQLPGTDTWVTPSQVSNAQAADPVSQTVLWRLDLKPSDTAAQVPGRNLQVRFVGAKAQANVAQRIVVPGSAVLRRGELTAVYVVSEPVPGRAQFVLRAVRVGPALPQGQIEVVSGLKVGERVALDPVRAGLAGAQPLASAP